MKRNWLWTVVLIALTAAGVAEAQKKGGKKLYRWVDKAGKVHYDDALPPEAVDQARQEFNSATGSATASVAGKLTPEQKAEIASQAQAAVAAAAQANEQKRLEDIMMASYETEADMSRAYGERLALLKLTIESTDISIASLGENLATILAQASDTELENRKVVEARAKAIRELHVERMKQQALQVSRHANLEALNGEFARMLARYREIRAAEATPPAATAPAPAASGTP